MLLGGVFSLITSVLSGVGGFLSGFLSNRRLKSDVVAVNWSR